MDITFDHILKFVPFSSSISSSFWEAYSKFKLNELKLSTDPVSINGIYSRSNKEGIPPLLHLQYDFLKPQKTYCQEILTPGTLISVNTIEAFKDADKKELLRNVALSIWDAIISGEAENNPSVLAKFLIFTYADLKKYHYYYWFSFPAFTYPNSFELSSPIESLKNKYAGSTMFDDIKDSLKNSDLGCNYFTLIINEDKGIQICPLNSYYESLKSKEINKIFDVWLGFSDPSSSPSHPGWVLRNLLTLASVRWRDVSVHTVFALRENVKSGISTVEDSLLFKVRIPNSDDDMSEMPSPIGWEKNERGKLGPRFVNMARSMDPTRIAESAVDLNLRLMKWRLDPGLDLDLIRRCRCLLIGAGTLGCNVARVLLGWNVNKITFVDNGRISYSNPVRQSLFTFEDCLKEGNMKAEFAAQNLRNIFPRVDAEGIILSIPMPGHPISPEEVDKVNKDVSMLEDLIDGHDAVFLLTDSRESRWLPALIGAAKRKIVLTAALGFDSFLVMRHGLRFRQSDGDQDSFGCYFCNDVVAPGDSTSDRSLDQQCTVTRPGVSLIAAGHIVELLVDVLQHPKRLKDVDNTSEVTQVFHSFRYYLGRMEQLITTSPPFKNCSACSSSVISEYENNGCEFLVKVFNSPKYLEEISGLSLLHHESLEAEMFELSDDE